MPPAQRDPDQRRRAAQDRFIQSWGQMAGAWGVSRTMAEIHALLYISGQPLNTDDVMDRLAISRGNASMSLRALVDWGLVTRVHKRGDRKEYFVADQDVWSVLRTIVRERKKRELDPVLVALHEIRDMTSSDDTSDAHNARLDAMLELLAAIDRLSEQVASAEPDTIRAATEALTHASDS